MKVFLVGANGQLGYELASSVPLGIELVPVTHSMLDICSYDAIDALVEKEAPDLIINTAAYVRVDDCEEFPRLAFETNAIGVKNLAEVCKKKDVMLAHISTDYVFDGNKNPIPYNENDIPRPINTYGISKYTGELLLQSKLTDYYIFRTASLYGKLGARGKKGNFVYTILNKASKKEPLSVINDIVMSPSYASDVAKEIWRIIKKNQEFGIYHVANDGYCSWYEFATRITQLAGLQTEIKPTSYKQYQMKAKRPTWSPLTSLKGIKLRSWDDALTSFLIEIDAISSEN